MLVDLESQQGKDGGQRRTDGSRQPFVIKNKQNQKKSNKHPSLYPIHPLHIQWLRTDLPIKFKVMGDRRKGTSKKTKFSKD